MNTIDREAPLAAWDDDAEAWARRAVAATEVVGATAREPVRVPRPPARGAWFGRRTARPQHLARCT